ncbi:hypothetical protein BGZ63DRAFT_409090 [Mariannaea sp. PMI_226]|nr:hypothetical protein BGZ63DRAFT_409090 [Mariannaea sp. PMI_226]
MGKIGYGVELHYIPRPEPAVQISHPTPINHPPTSAPFPSCPLGKQNVHDSLPASYWTPEAICGALVGEIAEDPSKVLCAVVFASCQLSSTSKVLAKRSWSASPRRTLEALEGLSGFLLPLRPLVMTVLLLPPRPRLLGSNIPANWCFEKAVPSARPSAIFSTFIELSLTAHPRSNYGKLSVELV